MDEARANPNALAPVIKPQDFFAFPHTAAGGGKPGSRNSNGTGGGKGGHEGGDGEDDEEERRRNPFQTDEVSMI